MASLCLGVIVFVVFFGIHVINPLNDDWIFQSYCNWRTGDTVQHYFGWLYYRESPWEFPIGMISNMTTSDVSLIFTDSLPIVAVICKLLSPILPDTFQYFGICTMLGFALNGAFGGLLLRKGINKNYVCIILSSVFIFAPSLSEMSFVATSVTSQWTILAALCLWFYQPWKKNWKNVLLWSILILVGMGLHLYIAAMVLGIFFFSILSDCIEDKNIIYNLIKFLCGVVVAAVYLLIFGFFAGNYSKADYLNKNMADLLMFFKPTDSEEIIGTFLFGSNKMTICAYLGIGIIVGSVVLIVVSIVRKKADFAIEKTKIILCVILMIGCFLFTVTPNVYLNGNQLFSLELPGILKILYATFRINGRFIWITMYLIDYLVLVGLYRSFDKKYISIGILTVITIIQLIDCYGPIKAAEQRLNNGYVYETCVGDTEEQLIKDHDVVYIKGIVSKDAWDITYACYENDKIVSSYYLARENKDIKQNEQDIYNDLLNGKVRENVLYVFYSDEVKGQNYPLEIYDAGNGLCYGYIKK